MNTPLPDSSPLPTAALWSIDIPKEQKLCLPSVIATLWIAETAHRALVGLAGKGGPVDCPQLTGKDAQGHHLKNGHRHAHILPLDLDGDHLLDHILLWSPMGLGAVARGAVDRLEYIWDEKGKNKLQLTLLAKDQIENLPAVVPASDAGLGCLLGLPGGATRWRTIAPFVPCRYIKPTGKKNDLSYQVIKELASRGLPCASVQRLADPQDAGDLWKFICQRRLGPPPPQNTGIALELAFETPVAGPICLGYASHFGLGLFADLV